MANQQYQAQIEALRELESHLHTIDSELQNIMRGYANKVSGLASEGLPLEVHDKVMAEFYIPSQNFVTQSCGITEQAISYVRHHIQTLEQLM